MNRQSRRAAEGARKTKSGSDARPETEVSDEPPPQPQRILREPEVRAVVGYGHVQLWKLVRDGKFPAPIKLSEGGRAVGWLEGEIAQFQAQRVAERGAKQVADKRSRYLARAVPVDFT